MVQTTNRPEVTASSPADGSDPSDADLFTALAALVGHLKRRVGDADTGARMFLLHHVGRHAAMRATDLAEQTGHDVSTISRHLRSLEDDGLLTRSPDPDDRRASLLEVTESGRAYLDRAVTLRTAMLADATAGWDPADVTTLTRLLHRLATDLETT
jgi:DNA-binding MarR family transcriptional regulator